MSNDNTEGYEEGSLWVDVTGDAVYTCVDNSTGAAVWIEQGGSGGAVAWGDITGTLADQTDLQSALDAKQPLDSDLTEIAGLTRAKGALIAGEASAWGLLSVGSDGQVLQADSLELTGLKWVTPSSGVSGSGTMDTIPRWTSSSALGDSSVQDNGSRTLFTGGIGFDATAASFSTSQNNLALTAAGSIVYATSGAVSDISLTGMVPNHTGQLVLIKNASVYKLTLPHASASSSSANRFHCPQLVDYVVLSGGSVFAWYGGNSWTLLSPRSYAGSTGSGNVVLDTSPTITTPTITTPTIASFVNATHNHQDAAGGGVLAAPGITSFENANHNHQDTAGGGTLSAAAIASGTLPVARGGTGVGAMQNFSGYRSTDYSIPTASWNKLPIGSERWDVGSTYDAATNYRFTPTVAGTYLVAGHFYSGDPVSNTLYAIAVFKNGSLAVLGSIRQFTATRTNEGFIAFGMVQLNGSTDYVELYGYNGHASATLTLVGGVNNNQFAGSWLAPSS